jgi:hypothetical protein
VYVRVERDHSADSDALLFSPQRRELFEAGRYVPEIHLFVIAKRDILAHADRLSHS